MRTISTHGTRRTKRAVACDSSSPPADYFYKNERKIQVGDCALFESPQDFPHLIGVIRSLSSDREGNLNLCVNKLYRPVELKLDKGIFLNTEPNEVFYSFHQREISAASLIHPCKVAFLSKGVDLPLGTSSFVCRRVFDSDYRRLKWLTDQSRFDEQQVVVDQLLHKTQIGMHATIQSGGRSPKPINGPTPMSQVKSGSDNVPGGTPIPSQAKGRKRERVDQSSEPIKRERSSKVDDGDSLKLEISKITEKGGLVDSEGVEKLVKLMQPLKIEKLELVKKSIFAGVIAATENFDCLSRFVQLKGLPVLDKWLQDIHKGPKDGDKSIEEFLFILLRALDKLPVNLQALQMCNIGKSVNHLRTHKNSEIQKKARSLVDTWKKRVEAEMNVTDTKSGANPVSRQLSSAKVASSKPVQAETGTKLATSSPASVKDGELRSVVGSNPDVPSTTVRDDGSSSSSQSRNSQSGSISVNKVSTSSSRPRRSVNGLSKNSTLNVNLASEKLSQSGLTSEKAIDMPATECSNHKLIVKIPNRGRSPAQNASIGPVEEPAVMHSRSSSPVLPEKNEEKDDVKTESWESNDFKEILTCSDEGDDVSPDELKPEKLQDVSFSSINALIESCVKYSQVNATESSGDDGGMNLLATVAAGELSKSNLPSPDVSSGRTSNIENESVKGDEAKNEDEQVKSISEIAEQAKEDETKDVDEAKNEVSKLKQSILPIGDKVDNIISHLEVEKEAASLDATNENKSGVAGNNCDYAEHNPSLNADVGEGCNGPSGDFASKSVDKLDDAKLEDKEIGKQSTCDVADESKGSDTSAINAASEKLHANKKPKFDLNEGFSPDNGKVGDPMNLENIKYPVSTRILNPMPFPAPITVAAAAKGPFVPPIDLLRSKRELGWKGSAATSAFRPAEPRKAPEKTSGVAKQSRPVFDFDLNVADELLLDDVASRDSPPGTSTSGHASLGLSVGLDLDLNRVDEPSDTWQGSASGGWGMEVPFFTAKSSSKKGFDLNDGPVVDEASEPFLRNPQSRSNMHSQPFFISQTGTLSPWFPAGNPLPPVAIPSILTERGDQPFPIVATNGPPRVLGPPTGPIPFGSVLTSSPVPYPSFQYPLFPFGTGFPLPSGSLSGVSISNAYTDTLSNGRIGFSASNSQLLSGPNSSVASHFPRPYIVSVQDGSNSMSVGNNSKWPRQGLDLNAGPGTVEMEARDELRQLSVASSAALADEQAKMFQQMSGGVIKRKENGESFRYKQSSWQ